jgi:hypothetical protein
MEFLRHQRVEIQAEAGDSAIPVSTPTPLSRAERAQYRLSWTERLARNTHSRVAGKVSIRLFGVPASLATSLGLAIA